MENSLLVIFDEIWPKTLYYIMGHKEYMYMFNNTRLKNDTYMYM